MEQVYQENGKCVAEFLKALRGLVPGERKFKKLNGLIEAYIKIN